MSLSEGVSQTGDLSEAAERLAGDLRLALAEDRLDAISPEALQSLTAAVCRFYGARLDAGESFPPIRDRHSASNTDVMQLASGLLRAADLAVFELGMWQNMTGR
jgi:hypothetical protein